MAVVEVVVVIVTGDGHAVVNTGGGCVKMVVVVDTSASGKLQCV